MNKHSILGSAILVAAMPLAQAAEPMRYDYIDAGLRFSDYGRPDGTGLSAAMSYQLGDQPIRLLGSAQHTDLDDPDGDAQDLYFGAGYFYALDPKLHLVVDVGLLWSAIEIGRFDDDDTGYRFAGQLRYAMQPTVEVNAGVNYIDVFDDEELGFNLGLYVDFTPRAALLVRYDEEADVETFTLGARLRY
jgi:hypothetical protein